MLAWRTDVVFSSLALSKMSSWYLKRKYLIVATNNKLFFCILKTSQTVFQWQYFAGAMKLYTIKGVVFVVFISKFLTLNVLSVGITKEVWESPSFAGCLLMISCSNARHRLPEVLTARMLWAHRGFLQGVAVSCAVSAHVLDVIAYRHNIQYSNKVQQ